MWTAFYNEWKDANGRPQGYDSIQNPVKMSASVQRKIITEEIQLAGLAGSDMAATSVAQSIFDKVSLDRYSPTCQCSKLTCLLPGSVWGVFVEHLDQAHENMCQRQLDRGSVSYFDPDPFDSFRPLTERWLFGRD